MWETHSSLVAMRALICNIFRPLPTGLAFPNITEIVCEDILITTPINNPAALNVTREKLFKHLRLETVVVSESQPIVPISSSHRLSDP